MNANTIFQLLKIISLLFLTYPPVRQYYFNLGLRWLIILVFSILLANFLAPICRLIAIRFSVLDKPDWRKIHDIPTPLLGGISVYLAFSTSLWLNGLFLPGMKAILLGASLIFIMGLLDDIKPLPALLKLVIQILAALIVIFLGNIQVTFFYSSPFSQFINIPLSVIWLVGITNALNFFDGIDGLATSISIIIATFLGIIAFNTNQPALGWFAVALIGSCIGFMPYNFRFGESAQLFLGDAGSTFIGFTLAGLAILGQWSNTSHYVSLTSPILIFGVLIFDMTYVNISRIKNQQARTFIELLTCVNKDHLHHRLLFMGFARKETVFIISIISTCLGVSSLIIMNQKLLEALLGLFQAILIFGLIVVLMLKGRERMPKDGDRRIWKRRKEDQLSQEILSDDSSD